MHRLTLLAVAVLSLSVATAQAQDQQPEQRAPRGWNSSSGRTAENLQRQEARPIETVPLSEPQAPLSVLLTGLGTDGLTGGDLSEEEILLRINRIKTYQSQVRLAESEGDEDHVRILLDLSLTELSTLLRQPAMTDQERFREVYRSVVTQYEKHYGTTDSLTVQYGEIFQARADMFAELNEADAVDAAMLEEVPMPELGPVETEFPMTMNRLVESSITYLLRSPEKHLFNWMRRAETYFPMIEQVLREEGVPDELKYLAMIESALIPTAQSWAAAAGMWQFIQPTGKYYGLQVNTYVDERKDPEKATRAAARHLKDLYKQFGGDWQLALAGYNCSPARIKRAMARAEQRTGRKATFWDIYNDIPKETRGYVPMFIATALIVSNPDAFNLPPVEPGPTYAFDRAPVPGLMPLRAIAEMAGTNVETLRELNPELRRQNTPATNGGLYQMRLPLGTYEQFLAAYAVAPKQERTVAESEHVVRRGESLGLIANRYGVTVSALKSANNLRSNTIHPGQRLTVAVLGETSGVPAADLADATAVPVQYGSRIVRPILAAATPSIQYEGGSAPVVLASQTSTGSSASRAASSESSASTRVVYTIRRGDSLGKIASRYGTTVANLKRWNSLSSNTIHSGQRLEIYPNGSGPAASASATYTVRRGDTLGKIASRYGVSLSNLRNWNNISGSTIRPGQRLTVKGGSSAAGTSRTVYTVRRGDNLSSIAARYGVTVSQIKSWNNLRSNTIRSGQRLTING